MMMRSLSDLASAPKSQAGAAQPSLPSSIARPCGSAHPDAEARLSDLGALAKSLSPLITDRC